MLHIVAIVKMHCHETRRFINACVALEKKSAKIGLKSCTTAARGRTRLYGHLVWTGWRVLQWRTSGSRLVVDRCYSGSERVFAADRPGSDGGAGNEAIHLSAPATAFVFIFI